MNFEHCTLEADLIIFVKEKVTLKLRKDGRSVSELFPVQA